MSGRTLRIIQACDESHSPHSDSITGNCSTHSTIINSLRQISATRFAGPAALGADLRSLAVAHCARPHRYAAFTKAERAYATIYCRSLSSIRKVSCQHGLIHLLKWGQGLAGHPAPCLSKAHCVYQVLCGIAIPVKSQYLFRPSHPEEFCVDPCHLCTSV